MYQIGTIDPSGIVHLDGLGGDPEANQFASLQEAVDAIIGITEGMAEHGAQSVPVVLCEGLVVCRVTPQS